MVKIITILIMMAIIKVMVMMRKTMMVKIMRKTIPGQIIMVMMNMIRKAMRNIMMRNMIIITLLTANQASA